MKSGKISFYFILYLVAIITVFAITVERDRTLEQRNNVIAQLVELNVRPLKLSPYVDTSKYFVPPDRPLMQDSTRIRVKVDGPIVTNDVQFKFLEAWRLKDNGDLQEIPLAGRVVNESGDGVLTYAPLEEGTYIFRVSGYKNRVRVIGNRIKVDITPGEYDIPYSRRLERVDKDTVSLIAKVGHTGVEPQQLTMNVQENEESWVLGPSYTKKIFVGGVESMKKVTYAVSPSGRIVEATEAESFVTFVWEDPKQGKHRFMLAASGNRGLGEKDRATLTFDVNVLPATFVSTPTDKGFWGVPYRFDGQVVGLNPVDLSVEVFHDGQSLGTQPVVPAVLVTPGRGWNSLSFKILYKKAPIKEHNVTLTTPPPPQIKWTQQNLDRQNQVFLVSVISTDAAGGPVTVSLQSQPSGIATVDKVKGTTFTITVHLKGNTTGVYVKLTARDQYGGQSISAKQFNISP